MGLRKKRAENPQPRRQSLGGPPDIKLHHGSAIWVLSHLGFRGATSHATFKEYIKSLRKLGIPFSREPRRHTRRGISKVYSYNHMMELALVLSLRVYHAVPDSVLAEIIRYRKRLYRHYQQAYVDRHAGEGAPIAVEINGHAPLLMRGLFLDLQMNFSGGRLVRFGPPKSLSPAQALANYAGHDVAARAFLPLNLSLLAERVVRVSLHAPVIRSGPRSISGSRTRSGRRQSTG
jgi:hypothetical protein